METIQDLIDALMEVEDKSKPVYVYDYTTGDIYDIEDVDLENPERVDLNVSVAG